MLFLDMDRDSLFLSETLKKIGYDPEIIKFRRGYWSRLAKVCTKMGGPSARLRHVYAGSKAEGITAYFENDIDQMFLIHGVICLDTVPPLLQDTIIWFETDMRNVPAGYTRLRLISRGKDPYLRPDFLSALDKSLFQTEAGETYISSSSFLSIINRRLRSSNESNASYYRSQGPATPNSNRYVMQDNVYALNCCNSKVISSFKTRRRVNDWFPSDILHDESSALCQLVPVGSKGSDNRGMEWRFCFIETEMKLTHSFNDTQLKLYILLKLIAKNVLKETKYGPKDISVKISSYIMKNVTYWISESQERNLFRDDKLIPLVILCLKFLRECIDRNNLPYYMIPERNLIAEKLDAQSRCTLSVLLSTLISEGPSLFFRIQKLRKGMLLMYLSPSALADCGNKRAFIERAVMICSYVERCKLFGLYRGVAHYKLLVRRVCTAFPALCVVDMETIDSVFAVIEQMSKHLNKEAFDDLPFTLLQQLQVFLPQWRMVEHFLS